MKSRSNNESESRRRRLAIHNATPSVSALPGEVAELTADGGATTPGVMAAATIT